MQAKYDRTRNLLTVHGSEYTVKRQRGRYYIHAENGQITVTDIVNKSDEWDLFSWYVLSGLFHDYPCRLIDWWMEIKWNRKYFKP